jgi:hypothetical protein
MFDVKTMLWGLGAYFYEHPRELLRAARNAAHLRFGIPITTLKWLATQFESRKGPRDIELDACPPGIRVTATVEEMGTTLRGSAVLSVVSVDISTQRLLVEFRLSDVSLRVLDDENTTPLAALVRSGALDLTRIANLVAYIPERPPILVEATDDRIGLDFMRLPRLVENERLRNFVSTIAGLLKVEAVEANESTVEVSLRALSQRLEAFFR